MWLFVASTWASSVYPGEIQTNLGAACEPACTVCHATNSGGSGTVIQEFGVAMEARGLHGGYDTVSLAAALDAMATDAVDSDGDGVIDVDELFDGTDPNPGGTAFCDQLTPVYGCLDTSGSPASVAGVLAGLALWTRRSRRG